MTINQTIRIRRDGSRVVLIIPHADELAAMEFYDLVLDAVSHDRLVLEFVDQLEA